MKTPYFVISEEKLNENIDAFKEALQKYWKNSNIAYSIKTNSLPWLLEYIKEKGVLAEAVSEEEYQLAKICGHEGFGIVYNGPIKTRESLEVAFNEGAIINIDSKKDIEYIKENKPSINGNLGIRLNIPPNIFKTEDIGYVEDGFRFGYSDVSGDFPKVIEELSSIYGHRNFGLHLHCNSITRSIDVYKSITKYASEIIQKYNLNPPFIDVGGGFFGGVEGKPTPDNYISIITETLENVVDKTTTKLIVEPGSAIIGSVVDLWTSVIDEKDTGYAKIITTDGSRIHIDPLWKKSNYLFTTKTNSDELCNKKQIICGYTCMDHDRIMVLENYPSFTIGDQIIYKRVGAYSMTFGGPFIRYFPDVYIDVKGELTKVRNRFNTETYYKIHTSDRRDLK